MTEQLTEPYIRALQNVAEGDFYRWTRDVRGRTMCDPIWVREGGRPPILQRSYDWLYEHGYITTLDEQDGRQRAELTPAGRAALGITEGERNA